MYKGWHGYGNPFTKFRLQQFSLLDDVCHGIGLCDYFKSSEWVECRVRGGFLSC